MNKFRLPPKSMAVVLAATISVSTLANAANPAACDPEVKLALLEASRTGAERATGIITNPSSGIGLPKSVFELGCLDDLYNLRNINILFDPDAVINGVINQVKQRICNTAKDYYTETVSRPFNEAVFNAPIPNIPGLRTTLPRTRKPELPTIDVVPPKNPFPDNAPGSTPESTGDTGSLQDLFKGFF